jgi:hypothetical protein
MAESPLTDREIVILRGMIDDHEYRLVRRRMFGKWWRDGRIVAAVTGGAVLITLELVQIVVALRGGH